MKDKLLIIMITLMLLTALDAQGATSTSEIKGPPQVRADSDAHWEWFDNKWPNAEQIESVIKAAEMGDAAAQFRLALMYDEGWGVRQDYSSAAKWLRKAAEQNLVEAQYNLAIAYESGLGMEQDHVKAIGWYLAAAKQGYVSAQKNLGVKYALGQGVAQDPLEAYIWFAIAGQTGDKTAINNAVLAASKMSPADLETAQQRAALRYAAIIRGPDNTPE